MISTLSNHTEQQMVRRAAIALRAGHTVEIIKAALKEAVLAQKLSLRYIDLILFEWKKKKITSIAQVQQHTDQFRQKTIAPQQQKPAADQTSKSNTGFYNWLDERE